MLFFSVVLGSTILAPLVSILVRYIQYKNADYPINVYGDGYVYFKHAKCIGGNSTSINSFDCKSLCDQRGDSCVAFHVSEELSNICILYDSCDLQEKEMVHPFNWVLGRKRVPSKPYFYNRQGDFYTISDMNCEYYYKERDGTLPIGKYYTPPLNKIPYVPAEYFHSNTYTYEECDRICREWNNDNSLVESGWLGPCVSFARYKTNNQYTCDFYSQCIPKEENSFPSTVYTLFNSKYDFCKGYVNQISDEKQRKNVCDKNTLYCIYDEENKKCLDKCTGVQNKDTCTTNQCHWLEECLPKQWDSENVFRKCAGYGGSNCDPEICTFNQACQTHEGGNNIITHECSKKPRNACSAPCTLLSGCMGTNHTYDEECSQINVESNCNQHAQCTYFSECSWKDIRS